MLIQRIPKTAVNQNASPFQSPDSRSFLLWKAVSEADLSSCKVLLRGSASSLTPINPNRAFGAQKRTALHIASQQGQIAICEALLDYGAKTDLNSCDISNARPLHLACTQGHLAVAQLLIRSGADINAQDDRYNTPLHLASKYECTKIVEWILSRSPDTELKNAQRLTPAQVSDNPSIKAVYQRHINPLQSLKLPRLGPNDFKVLKQIGRGSFGQVYLVKLRSTGEQFAMKVLCKHRFLGNDMVKYALSERNILSCVRHPFIVELRFAFQTARKLVLVLEYCPGGDLGAQLGRHKVFPEWLARLYVCETLLALEELHRNNILFRDLKPDNLVIDHNGHIKLTDFGLSKECLQGGSMTSSFCGTASYLAPEVIRRQGHGKSVDWYLLGVLLYELLVGEPPYYSAKKLEMLKNIQMGKLRFPGYVSLEARSLLTQLLHRNPCKRLGSEGGAEEVKKHQFFREIDWRKVVRKEVQMVAPAIEKAPHLEIPLERVFGGAEEVNEKVNGWSFAGE